MPEKGEPRVTPRLNTGSKYTYRLPTPGSVSGFFFLLPACFSTVVWAEADRVRCLEEPGASHT